MEKEIELKQERLKLDLSENDKILSWATEDENLSLWKRTRMETMSLWTVYYWPSWGNENNQMTTKVCHFMLIWLEIREATEI